MDQRQHVVHKSMIPGGSCIYQELPKMSFSECCSLFNKDNHSDCHLATDNNFSSSFLPTLLCLLLCTWEMKGRSDCGLQLSMNIFQSIFPNTLTNWGWWVGAFVP